MSIRVDCTNQTLYFEGLDGLTRQYPVSTALNGLGELEGSHCTPRGLHQISEKIGEGAQVGTIFRGRRPTGEIWTPDQMTNEDLILSRILWLEGLEEANANTKDRYIYFHGTNHEHLIGQAVSHGCIRLRNQDMIELFDFTPIGTRVEILAD